MTLPSLRRAFAPLALLLLAGCGTPAASNSPTASPTAASGPTAAVAPTPAATAVITGGSVAAIVNGKQIPMSTYRLIVNFDQAEYAGQKGVTKSAIAKQAMNQAIVDELVRQYASTHNIRVSTSDVNKEVQSEEARSGGAAKFQATLAHYGLTQAQYKALLEPDLLTRKVADRLFPVHPKLVPSAHVWHILIATKPLSPGKKARTDAQARALAETVLHQVRQGSDFAELAREYSDDTGSAQQGGDLGTVYKGQTVPPFDKAVFSAPLNVPVLVHSTYGYHIVEVLSRGKSPQPSQADQQVQGQKFNAWANAQMKKARITRIAKVK